MPCGSSGKTGLRPRIGEKGALLADRAQIRQEPQLCCLYEKKGYQKTGTGLK